MGFTSAVSIHNVKTMQVLNNSNVTRAHKQCAQARRGEFRIDFQTNLGRDESQTND